MCSNVAYQYSENRPDLRGTLLSPARGELPEEYSFNRFPRTLITFGEVEIFGPGIIRFIGHLKDENVLVVIGKGTDGIHDFPIFTRNLSENGFYVKLKPFLDADG